MSKKDKIQHKKVKGTEMVYRSISLPASLIEDLKLLKDSYEEAWKEDEGEKERVTYEKIFERLLSKSGLGHVDPDVYNEFIAAKKTRKEFPGVVTRATRGAVGGISERMQANGTSFKEEALKEQEKAKAALDEDRHAAASDVTVGDSPATAAEDVPQEGRKRRQENYWFINPDGHKVKAVIKTVKGNLAFFPEGLSSWGYNYRTLMVQEHWKMVDERGNEVPFQVAQQILKEFNADH